MCNVTNTVPFWMLIEIRFVGCTVFKFLCAVFGTILVVDETVCTVVTSSV
jgi:hypothetical protein